MKKRQFVVACATATATTTTVACLLARPLVFFLNQIHIEWEVYVAL